VIRLSAGEIRKRLVVVPIVSFLVLLFILVLVFVRASIEVGEERLWLWLYLFTVPAIMAVAIGWGLDSYTWPLRLALGVLTLVVVAVLLLQTTLFADKIYENPATFRSILPAILRAEACYLAVFTAEPDRYTRHKEKVKRWHDISG